MKSKSIEAPKAPLPLQIIQYLSNPLNYFEQNQRKYGDVFILHLLP